MLTVEKTVTTLRFSNEGVVMDIKSFHIFRIKNSGTGQNEYFLANRNHYNNETNKAVL